MLAIMHDLKPGQCVYGYDPASYRYMVCKWYLYPFIRLRVKLYYCKLWIYHTLNDIGIMHTEEGCYMRLSDIWKDWRWVNAVRVYVSQK